MFLRRVDRERFPALGRRFRLRERQLERRLRGRAERFAAQRAFPRLHNKIAIAAGKLRRAAAVRPDHCRRKHLRRVDDAERHRRPGSRAAVRPAYEHRQRAHGRIARRLVQKRHRAIFGDDRVVRRGSAEQAAVHQDRAAGRAGEPTAVQLRLRLTGAEIVPCAVAEGLDPGVVIVAVRPAGRVHLPRRDPGCAQGVDRKRGFLSAAPEAGALRAQRADGPRVGRAVADLLCAPEVNGKDGLTRAEAADAFFQLRVEKAPAVAELLLVHARVEHIIEKQLLGKRADVRRPLIQQQRVRRAGAEKREIIIRPVAERAGRIAPARQKRLIRRERGKLPLERLPRLAAHCRISLRQPGLHPVQLCV